MRNKPHNLQSLSKKSFNSLKFFKSFYQKSLIIILILKLSTSAWNDENDKDPMAINVRDYEDLKVNPEIENNCDLRIMRAYGMYADARNLSHKNEIFPSIKQNCCGVLDQQHIKAYWEKASSVILKSQKLVLYLLKGILTGSQDFVRLAIHGHLIASKAKSGSMDMLLREYPGVSKQNGDLVWHHKNYKLLINSRFLEIAEPLKHGIDEKKLKIMYHNFNQAFEFLMNVRRNFYGMICSVEGQKASGRRGILNRIFLPDDIMYKPEFCESMIVHHFNKFYDYFYFVKRLQRLVDYLPFFIQETSEFKADLLSNNGNGSSQNSGGNAIGRDFIRKEVAIPNGYFLYYSPEYQKFNKNYDINMPDIGDTIALQACNLGMNMTNCYFYCTAFSMVKNTDWFDGNPDFLFRTFRIILAVRDVLGGFKENEFEVDLVALERKIEHLKRSYREYIYPSSAPNGVDFHKKGSDYWALDGVNPFEFSNGCVLDLKFKSAWVIHISWVFGLLVLIWFNE